MSYISREKVFKEKDSIYKVTLIAAIRAIELANGSPKLVDTDSKKVSTIALQEISGGKVFYKVKEHKE